MKFKANKNILSSLLWCKEFKRGAPDIVVDNAFISPGGGEVYYWPRLNVSVSSASFKVDTVFRIKRAFLDCLPFKNRVFWLIVLLFSRAFPRVLVPYVVLGDLEGDFLFWGNSKICFDVSKRKVKKQYFESDAYLERFVGFSRELPEKHVVTLLGNSVLVETEYHKSVVSSKYFKNDLYGLSKRIAPALVSLSDIKSKNISVVDYISTLACVGSDENSGFIMLSDFVLESGGDVKVNLSHGDLKLENIVFSLEGPFLIDWELVDLRCKYHDIFNLLIHDVMHSSEMQVRINEILCEQNLYDWFAPVLRLVYSERLSEDEFKVYFYIVLLEKFSLYVNSGRWNDCQESTLMQWNSLVSVLAKKL